MQDINRGKTFNENESLSLGEKHKKSNYQGIGTAFSELDKSRKIAVIFLAFFSVGLFFVWGKTTKNRIDSPLKPDINTNTQIVQENNINENNTINTDSDGDGLTDQEEENLYNTSPYLEDTDSDGISDKDEVDNGTDPLCAEGSSCSGDVLKDEVVKEEEKSVMNNAIDKSINLNINASSSNANVDEGDLSNALKGESSADDLRKMLLDAGMDRTMLDKISDEDLLSSYKEILK